MLCAAFKNSIPRLDGGLVIIVGCADRLGLICKRVIIVIKQVAFFLSSFATARLFVVLLFDQLLLRRL